MTTFTQDDVTKLEEFGKFLISKAVFNNISIQEAVALNRHLQFYNQIVKKVQDSIFEITKVTQADETKPTGKKK